MSRLGAAPSHALHAWRFGRGLRRFLREPLAPGEAVAVVREEQRSRDERFLTALDLMVWPVPSSPYRRLLQHAGLDPGDVRGMVRADGLDGTLDVLAAAGVRLSDEEATGADAVRRGSLTFTVGPGDLANPLLVPDFVAGTSGTRSAGRPVPTSFRSLRRMARALAITDALWGVEGVPHALWRPALPASGGLIAALAGAAAGAPPVAWFSPTDPLDPSVDVRKRAVNRLLPGLARAAGRSIPPPVHVPGHEPGPVLAWCRDTLERHGQASLNAYPSAAVHLAAEALHQGVDLDGLVVRMVGEPVTEARLSVLRAAGAAGVDAYAFAQLGVAATACPECDDEELHVFEHEVAVSTRRRRRPDGVEVDALLWTTLSLDARTVMVNTENDDHAELDDRSCTCLLGTMGMQRRVRHVRGVTKSVATGVTVPGDLLQRLVDEVLPAVGGGHAGQWQLVERAEDGAATVTIRADPAVGGVDHDRVRAAVLEELRRTDAGALAAAMWSSPGMLQVERRSPARTTAGKSLAYHLDG